MLSIDPSSRGKGPRYHLTILHRTDITPYLALSYRWSDEKADQAIIVNGSPLTVMQTVKDFLDLHFKKQKYSHIFIDSICINQDDLAERASQVKLMGEIYRHATKVCAWIGYDISARDSWRLRLTTHCRALLLSSRDQRSKLARAIFWRQYWSRVWVIQEIYNARSLEVFWGRIILTTADVLTIMEYKKHRPEKAFLKPMTAIMQRMQYPELPKFAELLVSYEYTSASDMRDKVYALLGMATDPMFWEGNDFPVDYSSAKSVAAVFCDAVEYCSQGSPDFANVCMAFARKLSVSLDLRKHQVCEEPQAKDRFVTARGWVCCVIDDFGKHIACDHQQNAHDIRPMPQDLQPNLRNEVQVAERCGRDQTTQPVETRPVKEPTLEDEPSTNEASEPGQLTVKVLDCGPGETIRFLEALLEAEHQGQWTDDVPSAHSDNRTSRVYSCKDLRPNPPPGKGISAHSMYTLEPGDVICRFLSVPHALALRVKQGAHVPVGIVSLEGGALDIEHFRETEVSPLDIQPPSGSHFTFMMNMVAVAEFALFQ